jgi:homoserine O-acetyltransferase
MKRSLLLLIVLPLCLAAEDQQQFARIGDLKLDNGETLRDCVVGYRTFGQINPQKNNVVVFPTPLGGRSAGLASRVGAGKMVDSAQYYIIVVDSLADGVSSSPSNSKAQPGMQFPKTIRDMVNAEYKMLTDSLHLTHGHAVMGFSMGGMQAFQWAVSYPDFMDKVVSIVGSPQETDSEWQKGRYTTEPKLHLLDSVHALVLTTPENVASNTPTKDFEKFFAEQAEDGSLDANDSVRQTQAILTQGIASPFGGSLEPAAAAIHVPVLIVINRQDRLVNPTTSIQFARVTMRVRG